MLSLDLAISFSFAVVVVGFLPGANEVSEGDVIQAGVAIIGGTLGRNAVVILETADFTATGRINIAWSLGALSPWYVVQCSSRPY